MSYWIEYQRACFAIPAGLRGVSQPRYVIAIEGGSNNTTTKDRFGRERRTRDWYVAMIGNQHQVLRQAVTAAASCEGMGLRPGGRTSTAEAYIGRIRRLLKQARDDVTGHVTLQATVPQGHELVSRALQFGLVETRQQWYGTAESVLAPGEDLNWGAYFRVIDPFLESDALEPCSLGRVWGLPSS